MLFRERQQIIICVIAGAMVCGFALFRYLPLRSRMKAVSMERTGQMFVITSASAEGEQLPCLEKQLLELRKRVGNYDAKVPTGRDLGSFLYKITDLMNEQNLKEQLVQPGKEVKADELACIPISMRCKGSLKQIFEFYKSLQGLDRLVRIEQVKLTNDSDFSGRVSMQTEAVIYYMAGASQG